MKKINSRHYKLLINFCRGIFKHNNYISQKGFDSLIQCNLNPCSTRYRRIMIDLQLISEKNKMIYPGSKLHYFKQKDFFAINRLQKIGKVIIINGTIEFTAINTDNIEFPDNWELIDKTKTKTKLIFNVKNITTNHRGD